jgi:hypothetical protein
MGDDAMTEPDLPLGGYIVTKETSEQIQKDVKPFVARMLGFVGFRLLAESTQRDDERGDIG